MFGDKLSGVFSLVDSSVIVYRSYLVLSEKFWALSGWMNGQHGLEPNVTFHCLVLSTTHSSVLEALIEVEMLFRNEEKIPPESGGAGQPEISRSSVAV